MRKNIISILCIIFSLGICLLAPLKVEASSITPFTYKKTATIYFKGTYSTNKYYYDNDYLTIIANATSSDGVSRDVILTVNVISQNSHKSYRIYTDEKSRKASIIYLNGGSDVIITATCSDSSVTVALNLEMYS